ncbi:MAG: NosD domain-containing protein [archaeon]
MGRVRTVRIIDDLEKKIRIANLRKGKIIDYLQELKDSYAFGKISYFDYKKKLNLKRNGRTIYEWIHYYYDYIEDCEKKIQGQGIFAKTSKIFKRFTPYSEKIQVGGIIEDSDPSFKSPPVSEILVTIKRNIENKSNISIRDIMILSFITIPILILILASFYFTETAFFAPQNIEEFTQTLNLEFNESTTYELQINETGILNSIMISGLIEGYGESKIYIDDLLILDSNEIEPVFSPEEISEESYSESNEEIPSEDQDHSQEPSPVSETPTEEPETETTEDILETPVEEPVEKIPKNVTEPEAPEAQIPENVTEQEIPEENITEPKIPEENITEEIIKEDITEIKTPIKEFSDYCDETCDISELGLNKESYTLRIEISGAKLKIDKIKYELLVEEPEPEEPVNVTEEILENITEINITSTENITEFNGTINTSQSQVILGQPVKWVKNIKLEEAGPVMIKIPKIAENIVVNKIEGGDEEEPGAEDEKNKTKKPKIKEKAKFNINEEEILFSPYEPSIPEKIWNFIKELFGFETPLLSPEELELIELIINDTGIEYEVEYETPGPVAVEQETGRGKIITVSAPDILNYTDVLVFTQIPELVNVGQELAIKIYWKEENKLIDFESYDLNENGKIDYIEWTVPHLSNQTFEINITVLNVQSYPTVGGNWSVEFTTIGQADLTIKAINETTWSNDNEKEDLKFLEIKCGDQILSYEWENDSVFVSGYECNESGWEVSKVLTPGVHNLEFDFGGVKAWANNWAAEDIDANVTFDGTSTTPRLGYSVAYGDFNGDNIEDAIVGAHWYSSTDGRVYIFLGDDEIIPPKTILDSEADIIIDGTASGALFGLSVTSADFNGDNYDDVVVGAPYEDSNDGKAYVFFGPLTPNVDLLDSDAGVTFDGTVSSNGFLGYSLSSGYLNNDIYEDIIIGAPYDESPQGKAYVFFGEPNPPMTILDSDAEVTFDGTASAFYLGYSLSSGDFDGDTNEDLFVSSYGMNKAYIFFGPLSSGTFDETNADIEFDGSNPGGSFGYSGEFGDFNGDNYDDVVIGAQNDNDGGTTTNQGKAYVFFGEPNPPLLMDEGYADVVLNGDSNTAYFGHDVNLGDFNGDNIDDIIIGARGDDDGGDNQGKAYVFFGDKEIMPPEIILDSDADVIIDGTADTTSYGLGTAVALGDFNDDGADDALIGAPGEGSNQGKAYVFFGEPQPPTPPTQTCHNCTNCSTTIQGASYGDTVRLTADILNEDGDCIEFDGSDGITFDCQGHLIDGDADWNGAGISLNGTGDGSNNNTIKNCVINQFSNGIYNINSNNNLIINNTAVDHEPRGLYIYNSENLNVTENNFSNNLYQGIEVYASTDARCNNSIINNLAGESLPLLFYHDSSSLTIANNDSLGGIILCNVDNSIISNITMVSQSGILLVRSSYNLITNSTINDSRYNLWLRQESDYNNITNFNGADSNLYGLYLNLIQYTLIKDSYFESNNDFAIRVTGNGNTCRHTFDNVTVEGGGLVAYYNNTNGLLIENNDSMGTLILCDVDDSIIRNITMISQEGIQLSYSNNNTITKTFVYDTYYGLYLYYSDYNTIGDINKIEDLYASFSNNYGIRLDSNSDYNQILSSIFVEDYRSIRIDDADYNNITSNIFLDSSNYALYFNSAGAQGNRIWNNHFNNTNNIRMVSGSANQWNVTNTSGLNIAGGPYFGGNLWLQPNGNGHSETCSDLNGDKICDTPYQIDGNNIDYLPLINSIEYNTCNPNPDSLLIINGLVSCSDQTITCRGLRINPESWFNLTNVNLIVGKTIVGQSGSLTIHDSKNSIWQNGNLTIDGTYELVNSTLHMNGTFDGEFGINVSSTGTMIINESSNITNGDDINDNYFFWVEAGSNFSMEDSFLSECGWAGTQGQRGLEIYTTVDLFRNNTFERNYNGVVFYSDNNNLDNLNIYNSTDDGIIFVSSDNNNLTNFILYDNDNGIQLSSSNNNRIENISLINSTNGIYLSDANNNSFYRLNSINNSNYGINSYSSENNSYNEITLSENRWGIVLGYSSHNNTLDNITISNNSEYGIRFWENADYNIIKNSYIINNSNAGIYFYESGANDPENNLIYNNFFNNTNNFQIDTGIPNPNYLNTTLQSGTNIIGGEDIGGNYWAQPDGNGFSENSSCVDGDSNGICDDYYNLSNGGSVAIDWLPLSDADNIPPIMNNVTILPDPAIDSDNLRGYCNATDPTDDAEIQKFEYRWYNNSVEFVNGTAFKEGSISAGSYHTCGVRANDSRVLCWGWNNHGQLGNGRSGPFEESAIPQLTNDTSAYLSISLGNYHTCGIRANDSRVLCWGRNNHGQLGDGSIIESTIPQVISDESAYLSVSGGQYHTCGARANDSRVMCWGRNDYGQLGNGSSGVNGLNPQLTNDNSAYLSVSGGQYHTCGIRANDSRVMCWGNREFGQLGDKSSSGYNPNPNVTNDTSPYSSFFANNISNFIDLVDSQFTIANDDWIFSCRAFDGFSWSDWMNSSEVEIMYPPIMNNVTILPDPAIDSDNLRGYCNATDPTDDAEIQKFEYRWYNNSIEWVNGTAFKKGSISAGGQTHTCGIRANDSRVLCWGYGFYGKLGDGDLEWHNVLVPNLTQDTNSYLSVSLGDVHTCGIRANDSRVLCWGRNNYGQLGDGSTVDSPIPQVTNDASAYLSISAGEGHTCGIRQNDSRVMCWGYNFEGQLGNGSTVDSPIPQVTNDTSAYLSISAGEDHTCGIRANDSRVLCWGYGFYGRLGDGNIGIHESSIPNLTLDTSAYLSISGGKYHTCGIRANDSRVLCWGDNSNSQLGNGSDSGETGVPRLTTDDSAYLSVSLGDFHTCGIRANDSRVLCWGYGFYGKLGDGDVGSHYVPVPNLTQDTNSYLSVSLGNVHTCGIRTNDSGVLCWGRNNYGQLGNGSSGGSGSIPQVTNDTSPYSSFFANNISNFIDLIDNQFINSGDNWIFSCRAFDGFSWSDWLNSSEVEIEGNQPPIVNINSVDNPGESNGVDLISGSVTPVEIIFNVTDPNGYEDIDDSTLVINFTYDLGEEQDRISNIGNCTSIIDDGLFTKTFICNVTMHYYDGYGDWTANVSINDTSGLNGQNNFSFQVNILQEVDMLPAYFNFGTVNRATTNLTANPNVTVRNFGNFDIPGDSELEVRAYDLYHQGGDSFPANFFSAANETTDVCSDGEVLQNATLIEINVTLPKNYDFGAPYPNVEIQHCLLSVPSGISLGVYNTTNTGSYAWEFIVTSWLTLIKIGSLHLLAAGVSVRRKKKKKSAKLEIQRLLDRLGEDHGGLIKIIKLDKQRLEIQKLLESIGEDHEGLLKLVEKDEHESKVQDIEIPLEIFKQDLSPAEAISKFLKDNKGLKFSEIAAVLNRDQRTVWINYKNAAKKKKEKIKITKESVYLPINVLTNRKLSLLEAIVRYLKDKNFKNKEISRLIGQTPNNIWVLNKRAERKIGR